MAQRRSIAQSRVSSSARFDPPPNLSEDYTSTFARFDPPPPNLSFLKTKEIGASPVYLPLTALGHRGHCQLQTGYTQIWWGVLD